MMGMPISILWPKVLEILAEGCANEKLQGAQLTVMPEGLKIQFVDGANFLVTQVTEYAEVIAFLSSLEIER